MRVAILPTGRTEWHGLPGALERLFPGHDLIALPSQQEIATNPEAFPYPGFTSNPLGPHQIAAPPEDLCALVQRAAEAAVGDRSMPAADMVVVLDDVELANAGNEAMIVDVVRAAVRQHLDGLSPRVRDRTARALRERVSLHLVKPMIEGWFFADGAALARAGVPDPTDLWVIPSDPERFETADPAYRAAEEATCPAWIAGGRKRKLRPKWIANPQRHRHPKGYLQWLTREGQAKGCTRYGESTHGRAALTDIDWSILLARPENQLQYLRALVADLADALGQAPSAGPLVGQQAPLTSRFVLPPEPVLRNM